MTSLLPVDGFGSFPLTHSNRPVGADAGAAPLQGVQLVTRFCEGEQPYWRAFVQHYRDLGVERIHACVQSDADRAWLEQSAGLEGSRWLQVHRLCAELTPDQALRELDLTPLRNQAPFTLLVDCDEYLGFQRSPFGLAQLLDLYPTGSQWYLPWLMRPLVSPVDAREGGFWGHVGKPIVRSSRMAAISHDHCFALLPGAVEGPTSIPLGVHGLVLVHLWGRSARDCLIKVFCNRFEDAKSADRDQALTLIRQGELPIRLRLLAYLDLQEGYLPLGLDAERCVFDQTLEETLVRRWLSADEEQCALDLFQRYRAKLELLRAELPCYPAVSLLELATLLPPLKG